MPGRITGKPEVILDSQEQGESLIETSRAIDIFGKMLNDRPLGQMPVRELSHPSATRREQKRFGRIIVKVSFSGRTQIRK
jgi:hypothetical protein